MIERAVIVPKVDNNGVSLARQCRQIQAELLDIAGGVSVDNQRGIWKGDDGRIYRDRAWRVWTLVDAAQDQRIIGRLEAWRRLTRQECLLSIGRTVDAVFTVPAEEQVSA